MRLLLVIATGLHLSACASIVELQGQLEEKSQHFAAYQRSLQPSKTCENKLMKNGVVGGTDVSATTPLAKRAVLLVTKRAGKTSSCTAVPLTEKVLMTAAHCVSESQASQVTAVFTTDMNCESGAEQKKQIVASRLIVHPDYDKTPQSKSDLALVKLSENIPTDYQTAGLYDGLSPLSNDEVVMLGYGITDEQKQDSMVLRTTTKSYKADAFVKDSLIGFNQSSKSGGYCRGDSGAPIYVNSGGIMKIIGINSFNVGKEKNRECHTASFGMYMPYFRSWVITQTVGL